MFLSVTYLSLNAKDILISRINDDHFATYIIILAIVSTTLGKFVFGFLFDKIDFYILLTLCIILNLIAGIVFYFFGY